MHYAEPALGISRLSNCFGPQTAQGRHLFAFYYVGCVCVCVGGISALGGPQRASTGTMQNTCLIMVPTFNNMLSFSFSTCMAFMHSVSGKACYTLRIGWPVTQWQVRGLLFCITRLSQKLSAASKNSIYIGLMSCRG